MCARAASTLRAPFLTTWPVLTEAAYLLRKDRDGPRRLLEMIRGGLLRPHDLDDHVILWFDDFFARYADQEPQLADASLVWLAETESIETVFTLDRRDFTIYRTTGGQALRIVPETED